MNFTSEIYRKQLFAEINLDLLNSAKDEEGRMQMMENYHEIFLFQSINFQRYVKLINELFRSIQKY